MPKMPAMPTCTTTSCPTPHHSTPHAPMAPPPRQHGAAHQPTKPTAGSRRAE